ncbi:MAG: hypothetical protein ABIT08_10925 [Bacteroidia bacterium]
MPETEAVSNLVTSALVPCGSSTHGFQFRVSLRRGYSRHLIERFTFVQLFHSLLTGTPRLFPVRSAPFLERSAPQGGLIFTTRIVIPREHPKSLLSPSFPSVSPSAITTLR